MSTPEFLFSDAEVLLSPPVTRAAYSDRMAWILATLAELAYIPFESGTVARSQLTDELAVGGFRLVETLAATATDTQAILVACDRYAVLVFRGTEPTHRQDVETDLESWKIKTLAGRVHAGFSRAYASIAPGVATSLSSISELPLYITGHSLGAALATVCTQQLEQSPTVRSRIAACYTFGSPRVGDNQYDQEFKSPVYRVVNSADPVTMVPLGAMGFVHVGDIRFLPQQDGLVRRSLPPFRDWGLVARWRDPLADHSISQYRRKLQLVARNRN